MAGGDRRREDARRSAMTFFHRHRGLVPYLLLAPGLAWLALFFVVPIDFLAYQSLQSGLVRRRLRVHVGVRATTARRSRPTTSSSCARSSTPGSRRCSRCVVQLPARVLHRLPGRPLEERLPRSSIIAPFFVTYLIRTLAWQTILSDERLRRRTRCGRSALLGDGGRLLATSTAVVAGITYNFLPFMALPLYVSLEQIDRAADRGGGGSLRELEGEGVPARDAAALAARASSPGRC